ncbi:MAG: nucleoside kinase [Muribaculaceae bacterium]|nr:nucleoside kinase [Muribaculaceae bacterium]
MDNRLEIYCKNLGRYIDCAGGDTLFSIAERLGDELGFTPICAHVNNRNQALSYKLYNPKQVEFLPITSPSGTRVYIRSLCMILYRAVVNVCPSAKIRIEHSISGGHYCRLIGKEISTEIIDALRAEMRRIIDANLPLVREERLTSEVIEIFKSQGLDDKVALLETTRELYTTYYKLDGICDSYYGPLAPSTGYMSVFDIRPYKEGLLLLAFKPTDPLAVPTPVTQEKMYKAFTDYLAFDRIIGVSNVGGLNKVVEDRKAPQLIYLAEALHEKAISRISDEITRRYREGGARIVLISGPSSSGKTTTTKRLGVQLMTNLLNPQLISLDNYFINREFTPRDESGDYDYESLYALDLEQFNADLNAILRGEEVELPSYNFELGKRQYRGDRIRLDEGSILLIEGIHGLNPELTAHIAEEMKFRIYVSALTTVSIDDHNWIPSTDNRLLRRIIRDAKYRGTPPEETIRRWASVRRGEEKWIFPYQENADAMFNSSLLFELGVMKDQGEELLRRVPNDVAEYAEAYRLRKFLSYFQSIPSHSVPSTSVIREFLGGSSFKY